MKFSEQWLRSWVNPEASTQELVDKITMAGLEVDGEEAVAGEFSGVVVGEIVSCEQHPDADKLRVTQVSTGDETVQVVCGAPNARVGLKAPFAKVGAVLPGNFKIRKAKLRGVESFGMLCGPDEIGVGEACDGLMELAADAPTGQDLREYMQLNDSIIDVDLTPNRGDCLSIAGLAREVSANYLVDVTVPEVSPVAPAIDDTFPVSLNAPEGCARFVGRVIRNVDVTAKSPLWLVERLRRSGIRSIDPVVDVTNYVMLELGQPMHGYDLNRLKGGIHVRFANEGETLLMLDGSEAKLSTDTLMIADEEKTLGIAGVMGGEHSGINEATKDIFLEVAWFEPVAIAGKARSYGLHTDASHRFERGVDSELQRKASERATQLILEICGGEAGPLVETVSEEHIPSQRHVKLRAEKVTSLLGVEIDNQRIEALLTCLGLKLTATGEGLWDVEVPSWRFDISIEEDLIEEVGRIFGYNNLPTTVPFAGLTLETIPEAKVGLPALRRVLVSRGYREAVNFSFIDPALHKQFDPVREAVALSNPISSEMSVMRTTLLPGLVKTVQHNQNRQQNRVRLFESGQTFIREGEGGLKQELWLGGAITGSRLPEGWNSGSEAVDFFDLKGDVEALLAAGGNAADFSFQAGKHPALHPGQTADILHKGRVVGVMGALHPALIKHFGLNGAVYLFEMKVTAVEQGQVTDFNELSKFPEVRRDLAVIVEQSVASARVDSVIREAAGESFTDVRLFDVYTGKGVEDGHKSLALGLTWQHPSRTLTDDEVNQQFDAIVAALGRETGANLRA